MHRFLTVAEVANDLKVCKMTVYRLIHAGELEAMKVGKMFRITEHSLTRYLKGGGREARRAAGEGKARGVSAGRGGKSA